MEVSLGDFPGGSVRQTIKRVHQNQYNYIKAPNTTRQICPQTFDEAVDGR